MSESVSFKNIGWFTMIILFSADRFVNRGNHESSLLESTMSGAGTHHPMNVEVEFASKPCFRPSFRPSLNDLTNSTLLFLAGSNGTVVVLCS